MTIYVPRSLSYSDDQLTRHIVADVDLAEMPRPLVVLGDPGMGKSDLLAELERKTGFPCRKAAQLLRWPLGRWPSGILLIDALDEVPSNKDGDALDRLLNRLGDAGYPDFILTCRAADWDASTRAAKIVEDYQRPVRVLTLEPLSEEESIEQLCSALGRDQGRIFHRALQAHGLDALLRNPQTLKMLLEAAAHGVPAGRADLFERAAYRMVVEHNPAHVQTELSRIAPDILLDAAGAAMAMMLVSGKEGLHTGLQIATPPQLIHIANVRALPLASYAETAIRSRLFKRQGDDDAFGECHRTVAEFLGARWLSRVVARSAFPRRTARRLLALIQSDGRPPSSLRGLHAWLAYHSPDFAEPVLAADPYGVVRYGDLATVSLESAHRVWDELERNSQADPWFRGNDWHRFSVAGLVQAGLGDRLSAILTDTTSSFHLKSLLLDLIVGAPCVAEMQAPLLETIRSREAPYSERRDAVSALVSWSENRIDWPALFIDLCQSGDRGAGRLAEESLSMLGIGRFSNADLTQIVFAQCGGFATSSARRGSFQDFWTLATVVPMERCAGLLDALALRFAGEEAASTLLEHHDGFSRLLHILILRQIPGPPLDPLRVWRWLDALQLNWSPTDSKRSILSAWFALNTELRQAIQRHLLLTEEGQARWVKHSWYLNRLSYGLAFQKEDVDRALTDLCESNRRDDIGKRAFATLVRDNHATSEWAGELALLASRYAGSDPELLAILRPGPTPQDESNRRALQRMVADNERRRMDQLAKKTKRLQHFLAQEKDLRLGLGEIGRLGLIFLGYGSDGIRDRPVDERITAWAGDGLIQVALEGFEATLARPLGMSLHELSRCLQLGGRDLTIWAVIAGLAQRYRSGISWDDVDETLLLAAALGMRRALLIHDKHLPGVGEALEAFAMAVPERFEQFLRGLIEPSLETDVSWVPGAHYLYNTKPFHALQAKLLLEWCDDLVRTVAADRKTIIDALLDAPPEHQSAALSRVDALIEVHPPTPAGEDDTFYWLALRFLRDFAGQRTELENTARDHPDFLWALQRAIGHFDHGERRFRAVSIDQLVWLFQRFERHWPYAERPDGPLSGSKHPWDATNFLSAILFKVAEDTNPAAMRELQTLSEGGKSSYDEVIRAARARQRARVSNASYKSPSVNALAAAVTEEPPRTTQEIKTIVLDLLDGLNDRIAGSGNDTVALFYESDRAKDEESCRNVVLDLLADQLPFGLVAAPETRMPGGKRADASVRLAELSLPIEAKLCWNRALWTAASDQLDRLYASADHLAQGQGIYLVFWFGATGRSSTQRIPRSPAGTCPQTATELEAALREHLLGDAGDRLAVKVLDLKRGRSRLRLPRTATRQASTGRPLTDSLLTE